MAINKQKLTELLRQKERWVSKRNWYDEQYRYWVDNSGLWIMALSGMNHIGSTNLSRESPWEKGIGIIFFTIASFLTIIFIYKMSQTLPYAKKIEICKFVKVKFLTLIDKSPKP